MDWNLALFGECQGLCEVPIIDGIGCVWGEAKTEQRLIDQPVANGESFSQVVVGVGGVRCWKVDGN